MKPNNSQLVDKYVADTPRGLHSFAITIWCGDYRFDKCLPSIVYYFIVELNEPKRVKMFA